MTIERQHFRTFLKLCQHSTKPAVHQAWRAIADDNKKGRFSLTSSPASTEMLEIYELYRNLWQKPHGRYQVKTVATKALVERVENQLEPRTNDLAGLTAPQAEQLLHALAANASPFRYVKYSAAAFQREFGPNSEVKTPLGTVVIDYEQFEKLDKKQRQQYFGLIKPTLSQPNLIIKHNKKDLFVRAFINPKNRTIYFVSVVKNEEGLLEVVSNHEKAAKNLKNKVREGKITYPTDSLLTALNGSADHHPENYRAVTIGIPLLYLKPKVGKKSEKALLGTEILEEQPPAMEQGGLPALMRADEVEGISYPLLDIAATKFNDLFGNIAHNASIMIWGNPGQGKSTFSLQIARSLASKGLQTLYISNEEYGSMTLAERLKRLGGAVANLYFARNSYQVNNTYAVVLIDSTNSMAFSLEEFRSLRIKHPKTAFILIMQATKGGQYKGVKEWEHEVDIVVEINQGKAKTTKNRFAMLTEIEVFE